MNILWNSKARCYVCRFRQPDGTWKTKQLSRTISEKQKIEATIAFANWYQSTYPAEAEETEKPLGNKPNKATLASLRDTWLDYRRRDAGTRPNTLRGLTSACNWILGDQRRFPHHRIDHLEIETELTVSQVEMWIHSLRGSESSRLNYAMALSAFLNDAAQHEWISPDYVSPFQKKPIRKLLKQLKKQNNNAKDEAGITTLSPEQIRLLIAPHPKVKEYRRVRYLLTVATGLRDREVQALTWADIRQEGDIHYLNVIKQLDKAGILPALQYDQLIFHEKKTREEVEALPNALISPPKYGSKRQIPLHPTALAALQEWRQRGWRRHVGRLPRDNDPIFPRSRTSLKSNEYPGSYTRVDVDLRRDMIRTLAATDDDKAYTFHDLRHTFATMIGNNKTPLERINKLLGHAASSTAERHYIAITLPILAADIYQLPL